MTKVAYLFGTLDLQSTCDKWVAAAHYWKPLLMIAHMDKNEWKESNSMTFNRDQF